MHYAWCGVGLTMTMANMGRYVLSQGVNLKRKSNTEDQSVCIDVYLFKHMRWEGFTPVGLEGGPDMS